MFASAVSAADFTNPEPVVISGYTGPQQDAFITPDDKYLFFDSHNDAGLPVKLYWADRIDYKHFTFRGEIRGVNYPGQFNLRANYDLSQRLYFFTTALVQAGLPTIASGHFNAGAVTGTAPIRGIALPAPVPGAWRFMLDGEITADGNTLYFSDWQITKAGHPLSGYIKVAAKNANGTFTVLPNSAGLLSNVNAMGTVIYSPVPSADNLALYFTVNDPAAPSLKIYVAERTAVTDIFGPARSIAAVDVPLPSRPQAGVFVEMGSVSHDGAHLYYHRLLSPSSSQIYVVTR